MLYKNYQYLANGVCACAFCWFAAQHFMNRDGALMLVFSIFILEVLTFLKSIRIAHSTDDLKDQKLRVWWRIASLPAQLGAIATVSIGVLYAFRAFRL